jgi:hypothetical protein
VTNTDHAAGLEAKRRNPGRQAAQDALAEPLEDIKKVDKPNMTKSAACASRGSSFASQGWEAVNSEVRRLDPKAG